MTTEVDIYHDVPGTDPSWRDWERLVQKEQWLADDHCVTSVIPKSDTTRSVVAKTKDGQFVGSMVWNDYNQALCYLGFLILVPEYRAKGIGISIWREAMKRFPRNKILAMRGVPEMVPKYKKELTPIEGSTAMTYIGNHKDVTSVIRQALTKLPPSTTISKGIRTLSSTELARFEDFDRYVSGVNRSNLIRQCLSLPFYDGAVLFENGKIVANACIVPTAQPDHHLYKIAPIYANSLQQALSLILYLSEDVSKKDPKASFYIPIHTGSMGDRTLAPILRQCMKEKLSAITLFNREYKNPIRLSHVFAPNNNSLHTDL